MKLKDLNPVPMLSARIQNVADAIKPLTTIQDNLLALIDSKEAKINRRALEVERLKARIDVLNRLSTDDSNEIDKARATLRRLSVVTEDE